VAWINYLLLYVWNDLKVACLGLSVVGDHVTYAPLAHELVLIHFGHRVAWPQHYSTAFDFAGLDVYCLWKLYVGI